jgi:hypothetical protein
MQLKSANCNSVSAQKKVDGKHMWTQIRIFNTQLYINMSYEETVMITVFVPMDKLLSKHMQLC